jgi:hypothetical protein
MVLLDRRGGWFSARGDLGAIVNACRPRCVLYQPRPAPVFGTDLVRKGHDLSSSPNSMAVLALTRSTSTAGPPMPTSNHHRQAPYRPRTSPLKIKGGFPPYRAHTRLVPGGQAAGMVHGRGRRPDRAEGTGGEFLIDWAIERDVPSMLFRLAVEHLASRGAGAPAGRGIATGGDRRRAPGGRL